MACKVQVAARRVGHQKWAVSADDEDQAVGLIPLVPGTWERWWYDQQTGQVCGRTVLGWCQLLIFYVIYYTVLAAFWYGMMCLFFIYVPDHQPRWILDDSLITANPGLGVRPSQADSRIKSTLFLFRGDWNVEQLTSADLEEDSDRGFAARMQHFLQNVNDLQSNLTEPCDDPAWNAYRPEGALPCRLDLRLLGPCSRPPYGYAADADGRVNPCILLKLNRIFGLKVPAYQPEDQLPSSMPLAIQKRIRDRNEPRRVYIDCYGENPADMEALTLVKYMPDHQGLPLGFFPHQNKSSRSFPMLAVQFFRLPMRQAVHVECKAWYKTTSPDHNLLHFQLLIDSSL